MKAKDKAIRQLLVKMPTASDRRIAGIISALLECDVTQIRRDMLAVGELMRQDVDKGFTPLSYPTREVCLCGN